METSDKPEAVEQPLQFSVTRIGTDVFRLLVQSEKKTLYTANLERKNVAAALAAEIERLKVIPWR